VDSGCSTGRGVGLGPVWSGGTTAGKRGRAIGLARCSAQLRHMVGLKKVKDNRQ
jgi:hypothetical protein